MSECKISIIEQCCDIPIVSYLSLVWCAWSGVCAALAKTLLLEGNLIGDSGAGRLAEALPNLKNLKETWLVSLSLAMEPFFATIFRVHIAIIV